MKLIKSLYSITLIVLLMLTACQSDNVEEQGRAQDSDGMAYITLRIAPDNGKAGTRPVENDKWEDDNAKPYTDRTEMMNSWIVLITTTENKIVKKFSGTPETDDAERDKVCENVPIEAGKYIAYSFANFSEASLAKLLKNPDATSLEEGDNLKDVTKVAASINGNGFDPTADDNGFGAKGIPMSNKQILDVPAEGTLETDLIVVRMLAKIEVQVFNNGAFPATIQSVSLTDITPNADKIDDATNPNSNNLMLLPKLTAGADLMNFVHKDIRPNLAKDPNDNNYNYRGNFTYNTLTTGNANVVNETDHIYNTESTPLNPVIFTFYVNESIAPDNGSGLFYLSLGIKTGTGKDIVYSHALINQKGKTETDNGAWNYIARNDYRVIPVILTDWLFRVEPLAFVPIAGYPAVTVSSDGLKVTYNTGGMIALQPFVKKRTETDWRDFGNAEVNPGVDDSWDASITWVNSDGTKVSGTDKIIKTPFTYDSANKCFIGELNPNLTPSNPTKKTAITITVKLGPTTGPQFTYSFTCDVNI